MSDRRKTRVTTTSYTNKNGREGIGVQMPRTTALKIAVGDPDAIEQVVDAVAEIIEREEGAK